MAPLLACFVERMLASKQGMPKKITVQLVQFGIGVLAGTRADILEVLSPTGPRQRLRG